MAQDRVLVKTFGWQKHLSPNRSRVIITQGIYIEILHCVHIKHNSMDKTVFLWENSLLCLKCSVMCLFCHCFDAKNSLWCRTVEYQLLRNSVVLPPVNSLPVLAPAGLNSDRQTDLSLSSLFVSPARANPSFAMFCTVSSVLKLENFTRMDLGWAFEHGWSPSTQWALSIWRVWKIKIIIEFVSIRDRYSFLLPRGFQIFRLF